MNDLPNIVVLDGHTLSPGDLSWAELERLGECTIYPRTPSTEIVPRSHRSEILLTNKVVLNAAVLAQLPSLRYIGVLATGYNVVDVAAARSRGIVVSNVPAYGTTSVAQHTFALLLELTQHSGKHAASVRDGKWARNPDWCYWETPLIELAGLNLGIVGSGRIGRAVGRIAEAFGMSVRFASRAGGKGELESLLRTSDVVSLHCPLTPETKHLVNAETLSWMKPGALLINTSRGPLVDELALAAALNEGRIAGAGLDVLSEEPPRPGHPLLSARNCLVTPHLAWATTAARARLMKTAVENVRCFLAHQPQNIVS